MSGEIKASPAAPASGQPSSRLKILIVVEPGIDGAFRHVEGLIHFLLDQNQHVFLAYSDKRGSPELTTLIARVEKQGGKCLNLRVNNAPAPADIPALIKLWIFAREIEPDVIHSHSSKAGVLARALAFLGIKSRQLYTPHAYYGLTPRPGFRNSFFNSLESFFGRVGRTVNISDDERDFALNTLHLEAKRSLLIPIAVNVHGFLPATPEQKKIARHELGLPDDALILGWMGRLSFQKDPETLYRAYKLVNLDDHPCHLLHVGVGDLKSSVDQLIRELNLAMDITRLDYLRPPLKFYQAIDGLIMTSRYEGCPTVALEALSSDLPLILSQAPGTNWLGRSGLSHCWSAPTGDAPAFAKAISEWVADIPQHRESNHRPFALERFAPEIIYRKLLAAYQD